jgi:hypothetical protein
MHDYCLYFSLPLFSASRRALLGSRICECSVNPRRITNICESFHAGVNQFPSRHHYIRGWRLIHTRYCFYYSEFPPSRHINVLQSTFKHPHGILSLSTHLPKLFGQPGVVQRAKYRVRATVSSAESCSYLRHTLRSYTLCSPNPVAVHCRVQRSQPTHILHPRA